MKEKSRIWKNIIVMLVVVTLASATLIPSVIGKSYPTHDENEKSAIKNNVSPLNNLKERSGFIKLFQNMVNIISSIKPRPLSILSGMVHTNCDGIEESTELSFWSSKDIDVDKDQGTGVNGKDIRVQYRLAPWIEFDFDIGLGLTFILTVERLGEEIKDSDFSISFEILDNDINMGYRSPSETGNEIPDQTQVTFTIFFYLFTRTRGFEIAINPEYESGNNGKKIVLSAGYNRESPNREVSIKFDPAIQIKAGFVSTKKQGVWNYKFYRESSQSSKVTTTFTINENGFDKDVTLIVDQIPQEMSFDLGVTPFAYGGGQLLYESSESYDINLQVDSTELGACRYASLQNTPKRIYARWIPLLNNGEYHIEIESEGTNFYLRDSETNPIINFEVNGLETIDIDAYWNLTNPGDFTVYKNNDLNVKLDFNIESWVAQLDAEPTARKISTSWNIASTGYVTFDTDNEPFNTIDLLIKGALAGLHINSQTFKSNDFAVHWTLWPPQDIYVYFTGEIEFISIAIDIYLFNQWVHLWPW